MLRYIITVTALTSSVILCELLNKFEGDKCEWRGAHGTCVNTYRCPSAPGDLKKKDYPPICSFQGNVPIICCTDCDFVEDIRKTILNPDLGVLSLTGRKAHDKCVKYIDELEYPCKGDKKPGIDVRSMDLEKKCYLTSQSREISVGEEYLVILGYGDDRDEAQWTCAGTIISENFILTAAHCLYYDEENLVPVSFVGANVKEPIPEQWLKYSVKRAIPHPEYQSPFRYHDIALIETETITFSKDVLPACLHSDPKLSENWVNVLVWMSFQGRDAIWNLPLYELDSVKSSYFYPPHEYLPDGFNETTQVAYGDTTATSYTCLIDSGGPLVTGRKLEGCGEIVLGVLSIDVTCGSIETSGLFTRVLYYLPWIESIVWP